MIQLRLLGPLSLTMTGEGSPATLLAQPKRLALLAYLAVTGSATLERRDKVMTLFWPEQSQEKARHALSQGIHVLRRALRPDPLVTVGDGLGVDPSRLWCDAVAFGELFERGDLAGALGLYRGDLLDGFFVPDCGTFEHWLDDTRTSLRTQAANAAARLADQCRAAADARAADWAHRACQLAPFDERATRRLMLIHDESGNPGAALQAFDQLGRRLREELELGPSADLAALARSIRSGERASPVLETPQPAGSVATGSPPATAPVRPHRWGLALAATLVALLGFGVMLLRTRPLDAAPVEVATLGRVAVLPFAVQGDLTRNDSLGRNLVELLGSRLDGAGALQVIPADSVLGASREGEARLAGIIAGSVITGSVTTSERMLHVHATWRRTRDRTVISEATVEGGTTELLPLLDHLAIELLAGAETGPRHALSRTAAHSTNSVPALKAYLTGEQAFREGRFTAASQAFEHATLLDSSFALAHYRLGVAALWSEDYPLAALDAGARALRHSGALSHRDRRLLEGFDAWRRGERDTASSMYLSVLAADHDNLEIWFQLGETLFHYNPSWGFPISEARDAFRQVVRIDPDHWGALWHLAMLDALEGHTSDLDHHLDHLLHLTAKSDYVLEIAALRACAHRDAAARSGLIEPLRSLGEGRLYDLAWRCAVYGRDLDGAELMGRLLVERRTVHFGEIQGRYLLAYLAMARGKRTQALAELDSLAPLSAPMALAGRTDLALLPGVREPDDQLERLLRDWLSWRGQSSDPTWDGWLGRLEAELGHREAAGKVAARLDAAPQEPGTARLPGALAEEIRALLALRQGNQAPALRQVDRGPPQVWFGLMVSSPHGSRASGRFQNAEALAAAGRLPEALRWYASLGELGLNDLAYLASSHLRRADLYLRQGDTAATAQEYAGFLELWKDADPELQPIVTAAREKLIRLSAHR